MESERLSIPSRYNLYHFHDCFLIEPIVTRGFADAPVFNDRNLEINRNELQLRLRADRIPDGSAKIQQIAGLVGIIQLASCPYLIVISNSISVGRLNGAEIYRVTRTELIPFRTSEAHLNGNERHANQIFAEMIETVLKCDAFYYSHRIDISHSLQWLSQNGTHDFHRQPFQQIDPNFVWNARLCAHFNTDQLFSFTIPLIHGFVGIRRCVVNGKRFKLALISRRSVQRAGVRFHTRGLDQEGRCANFVETEQIVEYEAPAATAHQQTAADMTQMRKRFLSSFVQIRASVPLLWTQRTNLRWQPDPAPLPQLNEQVAVYRAHLNALFQRYGPRIIIVNLINQYGREDILGAVLRSVFQSANVPDVRFEPFDFHRHCSSLNWDRLVTLRNKLMDDVRAFGFFLTMSESQNSDATGYVGKAHVQQNGLFRTNCMDCLDRTNVVQALLAMESLCLQLQEIGILPRTVTSFDAWPAFVYDFKNLWADNGDDCSKQYAGTPALKTDYTRIGRRTIGGALQDAHNSVVRYFKNNLSDGYRQDAINLFLGNYVVDRHNLPDRLDHSPVTFDLNGFAIASLVFSFAMMILCLLVSENNLTPFLWLLFFAAMFTFIWVHGEDFSDHPLLVVPGSSSNNNG